MFVQLLGLSRQAEYVLTDCLFSFLFHKMNARSYDEVEISERGDRYVAFVRDRCIVLV